MYVLTTLLAFLGLFFTIIGMFVIWHLFRPQKPPADASNRINKIRLLWFALTREDLFVDVFSWLGKDELDNIGSAVRKELSVKFMPFNFNIIYVEKDGEMVVVKITSYDDFGPGLTTAAFFNSCVVEDYPGMSDKTREDQYREITEYVPPGTVETLPYIDIFTNVLTFYAKKDNELTIADSQTN